MLRLRCERNGGSGGGGEGEGRGGQGWRGVGKECGATDLDDRSRRVVACSLGWSSQRQGPEVPRGETGRASSVVSCEEAKPSSGINGIIEYY